MQNQKLKQQDRTHVIDEGDEDVNTPLHLAAANGHYYIVQYFLELYADPNARYEELIYLCEAAITCAYNYACFKRFALLHLHRNSSLLTPMHCAAANGWDRVLELLIGAEADIDPLDNLKVSV